MVHTAAHGHDIRGNGHRDHLAGIEDDRRPHGQGTMHPLRVDHAALGQHGIEGERLMQDKGVRVEPRIHLDSPASFAVYNHSLPAQLNMVWEGESAVAAPIRELYSDFYIAEGKVVFLRDEAGYQIRVEIHE